MKFKYKRVDTSTLKGLKTAERLQANGWTIGPCYMDIVNFEKAVK